MGAPRGLGHLASPRPPPPSGLPTPSLPLSQPPWPCLQWPVFLPAPASLLFLETSPSVSRSSSRHPSTLHLPQSRPSPDQFFRHPFACWTVSRSRAGPMSVWRLHLLCLIHLINFYLLNEWGCDPTHDQAIDVTLSIHVPICKFRAWRRSNSFRLSGYTLRALSPRSSSKSCKQGALRDSFRLLWIELDFDLFRVKQNKNKSFCPKEIAAVSTTQPHTLHIAH